MIYLRKDNPGNHSVFDSYAASITKDFFHSSGILVHQSSKKDVIHEPHLFFALIICMQVKRNRDIFPGFQDNVTCPGDLPVGHLDFIIPHGKIWYRCGCG